MKLKAFTLIEILVSIAIFLIIITAFFGLFSSAFFSQRKSLNSAYLLNNGSYITEYMGRALRMAQKDVIGVCIFAKSNYESLDSASIKFLNYDSECQEFYLEQGKIMVGRDGIFQALTPINLIVESIKFEILGASQEDLFQPKVSFSIKMKTLKEPVESISVQATVSQRQLDVMY